jgi:putative acetyltransferase
VYAEVSITALPFFQHHGFRVSAKQSVIVGGVAMTNYRMEKWLAQA